MLRDISVVTYIAAASELLFKEAGIETAKTDQYLD
jgi:hypothetical protein